MPSSTYKYIETFHKFLNYNKEAIKKMQERAKYDSAPHDVVYRTGKGWKRWGDLSTEIRTQILRELR